MSPQAMEVRTKICELASRVARASASKKLPVIARATPEWHAWRDFRARYGIPNYFFDSQEQYAVPSVWPPANLDELNAQMKSPRVSSFEERLSV